MIKLAYNKANSNLVFKIDAVIRTSMAGGIVEYYEGTLVDTSTVPDTETPNYRAQVMGFESDWLLVPTDIGGTSGVNNQAKTVDPSTSEQTIVADTGYTGLSSVTVNAVTSAIDSNIVAGNIKKDVTILGVTGTLEGAPAPSKLGLTITSQTDYANKTTYVVKITSFYGGNVDVEDLIVKGIYFSGASSSDITVHVHERVSAYGTTTNTYSIDVPIDSSAMNPIQLVLVGYTMYANKFPYQSVGDIAFANASVAWDGNESNFTVDVRNNGAEAFTSNIQVDFLDAANNVIGTCQGLVIGIASGGSQQMTCSHYINLANAVDVAYSFPE